MLKKELESHLKLNREVLEMIKRLGPVTRLELEDAFSKETRILTSILWLLNSGDIALNEEASTLTAALCTDRGL